LGLLTLNCAGYQSHLVGKTVNFAITTDGQWQLELPSLLVDEKVSSASCGCWQGSITTADISDNEDEAITGQTAIIAFTSSG